MDFRRLVLVGLLTLVALGAAAGAAMAQSGAVGDCLRNGGDRYQAPGPAVDDQYAGPVDTCQAAGNDVQVTVTPGGSGSGSGPASGSGATSGGSGTASAGASGSGSPASSSGTGGTSGGTASPPSGTSAPRRTTAGPGSGEAPAATAPSGPSAAEVAVTRAIRQADASGSVAGPSAVAGAPAWLVALAGVVLAAIIGAAGMQAYRRRR